MLQARASTRIVYITKHRTHSDTAILRSLLGAGWQIATQLPAGDDMVVLLTKKLSLWERIVGKQSCTEERIPSRQGKALMKG